MFRLAILLCLAVLYRSDPAAARAILSGEVTVIDGDTIDLAGTRIRLFGIDAPEERQTCTTEHGVAWACGAWVTAQTVARFAGQTARCRPQTVDKYHRIVARCDVNGADISRTLVRDGLAFAYRRYASDYIADEAAAAARDTGLHASHVQSPSQFRLTRAVGRIPPDHACRIKGNISRDGTLIYHTPGQRHYERTGIRPDRGERWFCSPEAAQAAGWRAARR